MDLFLSRTHYPVTTLGPGRRIGLWTQGCAIRCPGCISADTWAQGRNPMSVEAVVAALNPWLAVADGLTLTGGEPLEQGAALEALLRAVRPRFAGDVLLYSGRAEADVLVHPLIRSGLVDAVIPEPYVATAPQTRALRGGDNQPLIPLTELGETKFAAYVDAPPDRRLDVMFDGSGDRSRVWFAGIPGPGDFERLEQGLRAAGHTVATSSDRRVNPEAGE